MTPQPADLAAVNLIRTICIAGLLFLAYWLPSFVAYGKHRKQRGAILATNLLVGWTGIGWIVAMIWSARED